MPALFLLFYHSFLTWGVSAFIIQHHFDKEILLRYNKMKVKMPLKAYEGANGKGVSFMHLDHDHPHTGANQPDCGCGEHSHCGDRAECAACSEHHDPREELLALMRYMIGHNAQHANELAKLARKLEEMGDRTASEQVLQAVGDYEKGNLRLSTVLASLDQTKEVK